MRKYFIILFSLFFVLFSCTKTEVIDLSQKQEIGFRVINSIQTKTNATLSANVKLGVFARFTNGTLFFGNSIFERSNADPTKTTWAGNPPQYWPGESTLNFKIYAPYEQNIKNVVEKPETLKIKGIEAEDDFLYGIQIYPFNRQNTTCPITLKHAESLLCFKVRCLGGNLTIQSITVDNCNIKGAFTINYKNSAIKWDIPQKGAKGDISLKNTKNIDSKNQYIPVTTDFQEIAEIIEKSIKKGVMVIPGQQTSLTINYTLDGQSTTVNVPLGIKDNLPQWEAGKKYIYTITFNFSEISFEAEEGNWEKNPGEDINQDIG